MGRLIFIIIRCFVLNNDILNFYVGNFIDNFINDIDFWFILDGFILN